MRLRTLDDLPAPKRPGLPAFVRVDFNVPLYDGAVLDPAKVEGALPTVRELLGRGYRPVLASHLGRPKGRTVPELSLRPVATLLADLLAEPVGFVEGPPNDPELEARIGARPERVLLLENLRFVPEEEANDTSFGRRLARLGEVTVQDAFGSIHRAHASTSAVYGLRPAFAGRLLEREVAALGRLVAAAPEDRPFAVVMGGAKVEDKAGVIDRLAAKADVVLLGGALANAFLAARGLSVGRSKVSAQAQAAAASLLERHAARLKLPVDVVVARGEDDPGRTVDVDRVAEDDVILDIGPATVRAWRALLLACRSVFWNGPLGCYERAPFRSGSEAIAKAIAESGAFSVVGGGDSLALVAMAGVKDRIDHGSTGGGAALEFLEGRELPGLAGVLA